MIHCLYCDKALYTMQMNAATKEISVYHDKEKQYNSNGERICTKCNDRLVREGTEIECSSCNQPIYVIAVDKFREDTLTVRDLKGIKTQHDPIEGVINRCVHCKTIVEWG